MNRVRSVVLLFFVVVLTSGLFAQEVSKGKFDLPEPVFTEVSAPSAELSETGVLWLPDFQEIVYYLWNFDTVYPPEASVEFNSVASLAAAASSDAAVPGSIRNNQYFIKSVEFSNKAQLAFEDGDYDLSTQYAAEAVKYAQLSDEWVALQLKIKETDDAISVAKNRLDWAASSAVNARTRYPSEYSTAQSLYTDARNYRGAERWDDAINAAHQVVNALAYLTEVRDQPPPAPAPAPSPAPVQGPALPAQYTVRPWALSKDCFWNIAGRPWAYGDPNKWRVLYNANKSKLPQPDNPDLIHPNMILDIPSIKGETRSGMWDASKNYSPLR